MVRDGMGWGGMAVATGHVLRREFISFWMVEVFAAPMHAEGLLRPESREVLELAGHAHDTLRLPRPDTQAERFAKTLPHE